MAILGTTETLGALFLGYAPVLQGASFILFIYLFFLSGLRENGHKAFHS